MKSNKLASVSLGIISALACISAPSAVSAATLTFDDLGNFSNVGSYNGFTFNNFIVLDGVNNVGNPSGYAPAVVSPKNVIVNASAKPASLSSATAFTFNSAYITAAWNDGLKVSVKGLFQNTQLFSTILNPSATAPTLYTFNWAGIDQLDFQSFGGTRHNGYNGRGTHFALDNFTYNQAKPVPVPGVVFGVVVASGLFGRRLLKEKSAKTIA